jgi:hypothetical protein
MANEHKPWGRLLASGIATAILYSLLFAYEQDVMTHFTRTDGLFPLLPVLAAFAFSFSHGAFTAYFWDVLGVKPKPNVEAIADGADTD